MKKSQKIYASISADVVDSTSLSVRDLKHLHLEINKTLARIDAMVTPVWGRIVRGDTIECMVDNPNSALRVALILKTFIKYWLSTVESSQISKTFALRYSIGIGTMREVDTATGFLDGPAIYLSGRNLDRMKSSRFAVFDCETNCTDFVNLMDMNFCLLDSIINDLSSRQAIVIHNKLLGFPEVMIARDMGLSQAAVNYRSTSGNWGLINTTIENFENLNFEEYVR